MHGGKKLRVKNVSINLLKSSLLKSTMSVTNPAYSIVITQITACFC